MKLYIEYDEKDDLANLSMLMLDLNPDIKTVVLSLYFFANARKMQMPKVSK